MVKTDGAPTTPEDDEHRGPSCHVARLSALPGVKRVRLSREVALAMSDSELRAWIESIHPRVSIEIQSAREEYDDVQGLQLA